VIRSNFFPTKKAAPIARSGFFYVVNPELLGFFVTSGTVGGLSAAGFTRTGSSSCTGFGFAWRARFFDHAFSCSSGRFRSNIDESVGGFVELYTYELNVALSISLFANVGNCAILGLAFFDGSVSSSSFGGLVGAAGFAGRSGTAARLCVSTNDAKREEEGEEENRFFHE